MNNQQESKQDIHAYTKKIEDTTDLELDILMQEGSRVVPQKAEDEVLRGDKAKKTLSKAEKRIQKVIKKL